MTMAGTYAYIAGALVVIVVLSSIALYIGNPLSSPVGIGITSSDVSSIAGSNFTLIANKIVGLSGAEASLGYLSVLDKVFQGKLNATQDNTTIAFMLMRTKNDSIPVSVLQSELSLANVSTVHAGSYYNISRVDNFSFDGANVTLYQIFDIAASNSVEIANMQTANVPIMPYYQYTTLFAYGSYYGSVTLNAYGKSQRYSNISMDLGRLLLNHT